MPGRLLVLPSETLDEPTRLAIRAMADAAFAGGFSDDDWAHALGGVHAILQEDGEVLAHAAVVPRILEAGGRALQAGYVEAVAVRPDVQRTGLGTLVMQALAPAIAGDYELGALSTGEWHFYERLGWERWRGPTWVRHPDGRLERSPEDDDSLMILRTPTSPSIDLFAPLTCGARPGDPW